MVSMKPSVVSRKKVKNVEWFQKNCKILKLQRVYEKKVTKLSDFFVRVPLYFWKSAVFLKPLLQSKSQGYSGYQVI